jgi:hypothetical protein
MSSSMLGGLAEIMLMNQIATYGLENLPSRHKPKSRINQRKRRKYGRQNPHSKYAK